METVITNNNITEVLASDKPVLIDFWATWCGPCRVLGPVVDDVAADYDGKAIVAKCNVDDCEELSFQLGIRNVPTILFFKNGTMVDRMVGVASKQEIEAKLDSLM